MKKRFNKRSNPYDKQSRGNNHRQWNKNNNRNVNQPSKVTNSEMNTGHSQKNCLREDQVGITEYVSEYPGFMGILKSRYTDFQVNEIDLDGKILHLNNLDIPKETAKKDNAPCDLNVAKETFSAIISPEMWQKIDLLAAYKTNKKIETAGAGDGEKPEPLIIDVTNVDKNMRTQIHHTLKKFYAGKLFSMTMNTPKTATTASASTDDTATPAAATTTTASAAGSELEKPAKEEETKAEGHRKFIKIMVPNGNPNRIRNEWSFPGEYVHFLLVKENMDTSEVASILANRVKMRPSHINYCGTKDKRAVTTQKFCIRKRTPSSIVNAVKNLRGVRVGNFEFLDKVLKLGELSGNRFRIALRHLEDNEEHIEKCLQSMQKNGFINYFGLQRFGNCAAVPTYEIGMTLLKSDYKQACELILKPREKDQNFMREIRELWWKDRNAAAALKLFPNDKFIEYKLLSGLAEYGENDYASALKKIPRNMLLLYPHAFQSLIFNRVASKRIKKYGLNLIPGDLVYRNKEEIETIDALECITDNEQNTNDDDDGEGAVVDSDSDALQDGQVDNESIESSFKRKVKPLTDDDIQSGNYTIFDIVLPLPGYDIQYPDNEVAKWYDEILQEYGLNSEKLQHSVRTYSLTGAYRKLLIQPTNMSWNFCTYDNPFDTLIPTDWDLLQKKRNIPIKLEAKSEGGQFKALILDFCLPTSTYATMMLRDLLKMDTSSKNQSDLAANELAISAARNNANPDSVAKDTIIDGGDTNEAIEKIAASESDAANTNTKTDSTTDAIAKNIDIASGIEKRKADDDGTDNSKKTKTSSE